MRACVSFDRGFDHRQRHALGAVTEYLEIAPLHRQQMLLHAAVAQVQIIGQNRFEIRFGAAVIVLALPEGIVAIEADQLDRLAVALCKRGHRTSLAAHWSVAMLSRLRHRPGRAGS